MPKNTIRPVVRSIPILAVLCLSSAAFAKSDTLSSAPPVSVSTEPSVYGLLPAPVDWSHLIPPMQIMAHPAAWDWRDHGGVTGVRNQNPFGCCWAFASTGSMESNVAIMESVLYDFSEMELIHGNYSGFSCNGGGNDYGSAFYYGMKGTALETCNPYVNCTSGSYLGCETMHKLTSFQVLSSGTADNNAIKEALYNIGPVYVDVYASASAFQTYKTGVIYAPGSWPENDHAVLIVGYDDNAPNGGGGYGVWYIKNSWGTNWGQSGFGAIAYNSYGIGKSASVFAGYVGSAEDLMVQTYDTSFPFSAIGYGDQHDWAAVRYTPAQTGYLHFVGTYPKQNATTYGLKIFDNWNNGSPTVQLNTTQTGSFARAGYGAIALTQKIPVSAGNEIVVVMDLTTPGYSYPIPYDEQLPRETNKSYLSNTGANGSWGVIDAGSGTPYGDIAIRLLTSPDSDSDTLSDWEEGELGSNPLSPDSDADGLQDAFEVQTSGTSPILWDSDFDGLSDLLEYNHPSLDPNNPADALADFDADQNPNLHEVYNGTGLNDPDPQAHFISTELGCCYFADADGDGVLGPNDFNKLQDGILGLGGDYSLVIPPTGLTMDADGDGGIGPGDLAEVNNMLLGLPLPFIGGRADALVVLDAPAGPVAAGDTCRVTIGVRNEADLGYAQGFAVIFEVVSGNATLMGGDGSASPGNRYDFSGPAGSSSIVVRPNTSGTIAIDAYIPACGTPGLGRSCAEIGLATPVTVTVP